MYLLDVCQDARLTSRQWRRKAVVLQAVAIVLLFPAIQHSQGANEILKQADAFAEHGDWVRAGPLYGQAEQEFRRLGDRSKEIYAQLGRLHRECEAGAYRSVRRQVSEILADPVVSGDAHLRIRALSVLGSIDLNLDTTAAETHWNEALRIATAEKDEKWENRARGQLAIIAGVNGKVAAAGMELYEAIRTAAQIGDSAGSVHFSVWLANGLTSHGMPDRAVMVLDRAIDLSRQTGRTIPLQLMAAKIRALSSLPETERTSRREQVAKLVQSTLAEAQRSQTVGAQADVLNLWAKILLDREAYAEAEPVIDQAVVVARAAGLPREEAQSLFLQSQLYRATKRAGAAAREIGRAIAVLRRVEEPYDLPRYIAEQAETHAALGRLTVADARYGQAADLIEGLLVNAPSSLVKSSMVGALSEVYVGHFRLAAERLKDPEKALTILEHARGRTLYDSIRYARKTKGTTGMSAAEREISHLQRMILRNHLTPDQTRRVLARLDAAYDRLSPIRFERARAEVQMLRGAPVSVAALRRQLGRNEIFIEYLLDAKQSYALRITRSGMTIHKLPPRREFTRLARQFVTAIRNRQDPGTSAHALYKVALAPMMTSTATSLTIVPDGDLHLVPFAALKDQNGRWLNESASIAVAPSATVYNALRTTPRRKKAGKPFLGVAYSPASRISGQARGLRDATVSGVPALSPLPFGREEVMEAAKAMGEHSVMLLGSDASEAAVKAQPLADFRVIHLAAHGLSDTTDPTLSALVLAPGTSSEDSLWRAAEIRQIRLNANVVVLSACDTGIGRLQGQDGVMSMARPFLTAGARSVLASMWSVDDRMTATLMAIFYEHLSGGVSARDALRHAQMDLLGAYGEKVTPYYWAGLQMIGDGTGTASAADHRRSTCCRIEFSLRAGGLCQRLDVPFHAADALYEYGEQLYESMGVRSVWIRTYDQIAWVLRGIREPERKIDPGFPRRVAAKSAARQLRRNH